MNSNSSNNKGKFIENYVGFCLATGRRSGVFHSNKNWIK